MVAVSPHTDRAQKLFNSYKLTQEEAEALRNAQLKIKTHSKSGALAGVVAGFFFARHRKFGVLPTLAISASSLFVGMQLGMLTGTAAAAGTIARSPNREKIMKILWEVQNDISRERTRRTQSTNSDNARYENNDQTPIEDGFGREIVNDSYTQKRVVGTSDNVSVDERMRTIDNDDNEHESGSQVQSPTSQKPEQRDSLSTWEKIRRQANIERRQKQERHQKEMRARMSQNNEHPEAEAGAQQYMSASKDETFDLPRTREEMEQREGKTKTNQYGDPI